MNDTVISPIKKRVIISAAREWNLVASDSMFNKDVFMLAETSFIDNILKHFPMILSQ